MSSEGLIWGADDYIIQPFRPLELMVRVKALLRRTQPIPSVGGNGLFEHGDLRINFASTQVAPGERKVKLTDTEYRLLYHLTKNAGKTVPHRKLLRLVWGREYTDETHYLKGYIKQLREKLEDDSPEPRYILTERNVGSRPLLFDGGMRHPQTSNLEGLAITDRCAPQVLGAAGAVHPHRS